MLYPALIIDDEKNGRKNLFWLIIPFFSLILILFACTGKQEKSKNSTQIQAATPTIDYFLVNSFPHDTTAFTEGFLIYNGKLYESTGASRELPQTRSLFGVVDLKTGKIEKKIELDKTMYFGEGIAFLNGKVYQLTYKTKVGFIYDSNSFKKLGEFTFPSDEGWGMTTDDKNLIMSDGTHKLTYLDPNTLQVTKTLSVSENGYVKEKLNELEFINGYIYANIWMTNTIVKINPENGNVVGLLDLTSLADEAKNVYPWSQEMNGIAYDSSTDKIYVTGKLWPKIYEIKFNH
jgi:glutamine cyclotransferase